MIRLTFKEPNGEWGIVGMNSENESEKMYAVASKLLEYEETGLQPDDVLTGLEMEEIYVSLKELNKYKDLNIIKVIARNLMAWETSKDKSQGLLPEVYLTNKYVFEELTGEDACWINYKKYVN